MALPIERGGVARPLGRRGSDWEWLHPLPGYGVEDPKIPELALLGVLAAVHENFPARQRHGAVPCSREKLPVMYVGVSVGSFGSGSQAEP